MPALDDTPEVAPVSLEQQCAVQPESVREIFASPPSASSPATDQDASSKGDTAITEPAGPDFVPAIDFGNVAEGERGTSPPAQSLQSPSVRAPLTLCQLTPIVV